MNSFDALVVANAAILPAVQGGAVSVEVTGKTDVILDTNGYFGPPGSMGGLQFYPVAPCRAVDTRAGSGKTGIFGTPALQGGETRILPMMGSGCGLPETAQAYSINVTAIPRGSSLAYLTIWPDVQAKPVASTLNSFAGKVVSNAAIVPGGFQGAINLYVSDSTDVVIDVTGYFAP